MAQSDNKWLYLLRRISRRMWFRASLYCGLAVLAALVGVVVSPVLPDAVADRFGADAVRPILSILATSMLAVTTFSLSTMVSAYSTASQSATPRAAMLLIEDNGAQGALATFIGAFLFSIAGLIALSAGVYGNGGGRLVLFLATIVVIVLITVTLLRWIEQLARLGRVRETIRLVEDATRSAMRLRILKPWLGGAPAQATHDDDWQVHTGRIGYVQYLDMQRLGRLAKEREVRIHVTALPGTFVAEGRPLAVVSGAMDQDLACDIRKAFDVGDMRTFEHDPRYGLVVLTEIAARALSPAVNDPGTCIDVIGTVVRLISDWSTARMKHVDDAEIEYPDVFVAGLDEADFFDDVFPLISREGAHMREVGVRLQKAYAALEQVDYAPCQVGARLHARQSLERAMQAMAYLPDRQALRSVAIDSAIDAKA